MESRHGIVHLNRDAIEAYAAPAASGEARSYGVAPRYGRDGELALILDRREVARILGPRPDSPIGAEPERAQAKS
jgi:hypothetical protein